MELKRAGFVEMAVGKTRKKFDIKAINQTMKNLGMETNKDLEK